MAKEIDYSSVEVPKDESPKDYHYTARRADILKDVLGAGSPAAINQSRMAERYGVSQGQISQDMDALGEHVADGLGVRAALDTRAAYHRIRRELFAEGEWKNAWDVIMDWNDWLGDIGAQERAPDKHEHEHRDIVEIQRERLERAEKMRDELGTTDMLNGAGGTDGMKEPGIVAAEVNDGPEELTVEVSTDYPEGVGPETDSDSIEAADERTTPDTDTDDVDGGDGDDYGHDDPPTDYPEGVGPYEAADTDDEPVYRNEYAYTHSDSYSGDDGDSRDEYEDRHQNRNRDRDDYDVRHRDRDRRS